MREFKDYDIHCIESYATAIFIESFWLYVSFEFFGLIADYIMGHDISGMIDS